MLETKPQPVDRTVRMAARPASRASLTADSPPTARPSQRASSDTSVRPDRAAKAAGNRLSRSEARLLTMAISCTVVVCTLLVLYLAAYAHVALLGIDQAKMRTQLREKRLQNEMYRAQVADLQNPDRVAAAATALGLTREHKRVDYIAPPTPEADRIPAGVTASSDDAVTDRRGKAGLQVANSGPIPDDNQPTRND